MKFMLLLLVALIGALVGLSLADTRVLHNFEINVDDSTRKDTFSLNNENTPEEELVIKGTDRQIFPDKDGYYVYVVETIYVADKDGNRVKYKLVRKMQVLDNVHYGYSAGPEQPVHAEPAKRELNISSIRSLAGGW